MSLRLRSAGVMWLAMLTVAATTGASHLPAARDRPNVLLIMADDLGVNDLGMYGRRDHRTPRLDRLASEGARFTNAFAAASVCSPSRAALLTGLSPARLHLTTFIPGRPDARTQRLLQPRVPPGLPLEHVTLAERLAAAGYVTGMVGKWHLGGREHAPRLQGFAFDHRGQANTTPSRVEGSKGEFDLTAAAERFLDEHHQQPFFLFLSHNNPHIPFAARPSAEVAADAFEPTYADVIATLDMAVGRLLDHLEARGLRERTLVIFTSDNGGLHVPEQKHARVTHNTPYRAGKGFLYEGGIRIPLVVRWPGRVKAGDVITVPMTHSDWMPTLLEALQLPAPAVTDGSSRASVLLGNGRPPARPLYWHQPHYTNQGGRPSGAIRDGDWKLLEDYESGSVELYNIARDPAERYDLAKAEPRRAAGLRQRLASWRRGMKAEINRPNPQADADAHRVLYRTFDASRFDPLNASDDQWRQIAEWRRSMDSAIAGATPPR